MQRAGVIFLILFLCVGCKAEMTEEPQQKIHFVKAEEEIGDRTPEERAMILKNRLKQIEEVAGTAVIVEGKTAIIGLRLKNGMELLIHEGVDTVALKGEGFTLYVKEGDSVKAGDKLIKFDAELIKSKGYQITCILAVTNSDEYPNMKLYTGMDAVAGETIIAEAK